MKKVIVILFAAAFLYSCGGGSAKDDKKKDDKPTVAADDHSNDPVYQKGLDLVAKSDCFTCHKIDEALTGPAYRDVANKYASMPDTIITHLAGKIIKGGTGVWGQTIMTPHATLSESDAEDMVRYIFKLKK